MKNYKVYLYIFIIQIIITFGLTFYYQNNPFIITILLSLFFEMILLIVTVQIIKHIETKLDTKKKNVDLVFTNSKIKKQKMTEINHKYNNYKKIITAVFFFTILIPLGAVYYEEHRTVRIDSIRDFRKIYDNPNGRYILDEDLDFKDYEKSLSECDKKSTFDGLFEGNNHAIKNLTQPLFYCIGKEEGIVQNLSLKDVSIKIHEDDIGTIAKYNYGLINQVHVIGEITGEDNVGGLVGRNLQTRIGKDFLFYLKEGRIKQSSFNGVINGEQNIGGISGINHGVIKETFVYGEIKGDYIIGGISGTNNSGKISASYTNTTLRGERLVGGVIGFTMDWQTIDQCFVLGDIYAEDIYLLGDNIYSTNSFYVGNVYGENITNKTKAIVYENSNIKTYQLRNIHYIDSLDLLSRSWYIENDFDDLIWDFSTLDEGNLPILKNLSHQSNYQLTE